MAKRALVVGSQTGSLTGVYNDVDAIADGLAGWGFATELCAGEDATRQGILDRYLDLIEGTVPGDPVVIYYSGHGGWVANPDYQPPTEQGVRVPRYYQFIVPVDIEESTEDDFRGITSLELSALLAQLTKKTKNVTVILDCCHSARMSRDLDLLPRAWPRPCFVNIARHLKDLADRGITRDAVDVESNPDAVRLVAAPPDQSAYEYTNAWGRRHGLLTESFLTALEEAEGLKVSWRSLGTRVRERVLSVVPYQRPEIEGPADRLLFEVDTVDLTGVLPVILREGQPVLQGGRLLGIHEGDEYAIAPMGVEKPTPENQIARATVRRVAGGISKIEIAFCGAHTSVPEGANAFPVSTMLPKRPVWIRASGQEKQALIEAIDRSRHVQAAAEQDLAEVDSAEVLAKVVVSEGQIELQDPSGLSLVEPKPYSGANVEETVTNLDRFARVQAILNLASGEGKNAFDTPYEVEWGRVVDGKPEPLAEAGALVSAGDPVYARVANSGQEKIYLSLFDVGIGGKITLLTAAEPSGVGLRPGEDYLFGYKEEEGLIGVKLSWPAGIPRDAPRRESLLVINSDRPQDLRSLTGEGMRGFEEPPAFGTLRKSPLEETMEHFAFGGARDLSAEGQPQPDVRYAVHRIDFQVDPNPAPALDKGTFLLDDRPEPSFLLRMPEAKGEAPSTVAIRLKDLIVHRNRALRSTEIRLDVLVVTGPSSGDGGPSYEMKTARFPGINDGDRLPFDNLLAYYGPVAHFLDMAVWVSRNQEDSQSLADLFKKELNSDEFKAAAAVLAGLAVAAPQAALVVSALGASATLINIGTKLLLQAAGKSVGLYRTSHLAFERFGEGRHPANGLMTAQDYSFGYEIVAIE